MSLPPLMVRRERRLSLFFLNRQFSPPDPPPPPHHHINTRTHTPSPSLSVGIVHILWCLFVVHIVVCRVTVTRAREIVKTVQAFGERNAPKSIEPPPQVRGRLSET